MQKTIFIVEDNAIDRQILSKMVEKIGLAVKTAADGFEAISMLKSNPNLADLILLDLYMPEIDGISALGHFRVNYPKVPVIIVTSSEDVEDATQVMKLGAIDFIQKPADAKRLEVSIINALRLNELDNEVKLLKKAKNGQIIFEDLIGHNGGLKKQVELGKKAASSDISVLITGESGTGKELFAQAIHGESKRAGKPFIAINCGAIPKNLIESILFGHEKGSFTGAIGKTLGKFREAAGGTIFLDEIGDLPLDAQVKILRALQNRTIEPVGLGKEVPIDVRIISATNKTLINEVKNGNFREDLFFRLNTMPIHLPPLRERGHDITELTKYFVSKFSAEENKAVLNITDNTMNKIMKYQWTGNVRELENALQRAVLLSDGANLEIDDISGYGSIAASFEDSVSLYEDNGQIRNMDRIEEEVINFYLNKYDNKVEKVAEILGISKATIYRRLKNLG